MNYSIAFPLLLLVACATDLPKRTGTAEKTVQIEFVSDIRSKCGDLYPTASACAINGQVYMNGRGEISGTYDRSLSVRYVDYEQLGDECGRISGGPTCWDEAGSMVYHDSQSGSESAECEAGNMLLTEWGITEHYSPTMGCELGHEVMFHVFGGHWHPKDWRDPDYTRIALDATWWR